MCVDSMQSRAGRQSDPFDSAGTLEHFPAKHALGLDPGVDTGSPPENAIT
jgi:hypothetical protein